MGSKVVVNSNCMKGISNHSDVSTQGGVLGYARGSVSVSVLLIVILGNLDEGTEGSLSHL